MGEVVKIYQKDNVQKRKFRVMVTNGSQNPTGGSNQATGGTNQPTGGTNHPSPNVGSGPGKILNYLGIAGGIITVIAAISTVIYKVAVPITQHTDAINEIKSYMVNIDDDMETLSGDLKKLSEYVYTNVGGNKGEYSKNDIKDKAKKVRFIDNNLLEIDLANNEPEFPESPESQSTNWKEYAFVAEDEDGNELNSDDLQNVTFITAYMEGGKEVYFLGQYNENNRWDGKCTLNVFDGEKLDSVLEAIYNDGELYSYKRISREKDGTWKVADKTKGNTQNKTKEYKIGQTWIYNVSETYKKNISFDNYDESMILTYENFSYLEDEELISYYNGKTSDGYYNESKQDSYLIEYFTKDEIDFGENKRVIKTLYKGNFVEGDLVDESDMSWEITREPNTTYMIYEGSFSNNSADRENVKDFINPAEYEDIEKKLREEGFEEYLDEFLIDY